MKYMALAAIALGGMALVSCGAKTSEKTEKADTVAVEEYPAEPVKTAAEVLAEYAPDAEVKTTDTGLKYVIVTEGTGASPKATDNVKVHYTGKLVNGTVFDSSVDRGEPATFPLGGVIPGWTEGLQLMKEGGKTVFYIPSNLAYGPQGIPGVIPGGADLVFEVELLKVNPE